MVQVVRSQTVGKGGAKTWTIDDEKKFIAGLGMWSQAGTRLTRLDMLKKYRAVCVKRKNWPVNAMGPVKKEKVIALIDEAINAL